MTNDIFTDEMMISSATKSNVQIVSQVNVDTFEYSLVVQIHSGDESFFNMTLLCSTQDVTGDRYIR